ncbi:type IV secretion protein Rhs [Patiriisocius marinistellae]|uniref:Type IV secretion protein Rhs n=1 Tax=Patiriisocius marinistellae TaxID=2494560 RepID=A0A5J4FW59_9FLAO|nr:DUF6531 domain-containing protein [Patiriisocius marinistellae]GEQ86163.1 type IV secretion protein Rhs [Patiriisocius marinistellae]
MMPSNKHLDPVLGVDIHIVMIPSPAGPIPTPLPHPFVGMILDPMDYVPVIGATVMVNKKPRGNSGTAGMLGSKVHIPMGGPFMMAATIGHDSANFFGSNRVNADGSYLSASGFMVMSCNDVGMPLTAAPGKKMKPKPGMYLPTSATVPIPAGPPVIVGGPYVPDLMGALMALAMSFGMGAVMKAAGKGLKKLNHLVLKKFPATQGLSKKLCKMGFEPVDLVTGRMVYDGEDFFIPGVIPISWERNWYSDSSYQGLMGHGFHCNYDTALHVEEADHAIVLRLPDGRVTSFPYLIAEGDSFYLRQEKLTLTCIDVNTYEIENHTTGLIDVFSKATGSSFKISATKNKDGLANMFFYDAANNLEQIIDTAGRRINIKTDNEGRAIKITAIHDGAHKDLIEYTYNKEGDLTGITDAMGKTTVMEYINHLMVKKTDRNGQAFYWEYDGKTTGAKCTRTWGDGGILAGTIVYGKGQNLVTDSLGNQTIYYFDSNNLCTQVTDAEGNHIFHEYTEFMEPYRDIDEQGDITGYTYDDFGNLKSIIQPDGNAYTFIYDEEDRLIASISPEGVKTAKVYKEHKVFATVNTNGSTTTYKYNENGLIASITDSAGNSTFLEYTPAHNLTKVTFPNDGVATWVYDAWGNVIQKINAENHIEQFSYDALDRVTKILLPDNNIVALAYNAYDEVTELVDAKKNEVHFEYTPLGSLKLREENGTTVKFKYNTEEQLVAIENEHEELYIFGRNKKGEVINETGFDGLRREYKRDAEGKVIKTLRPGGRFTEQEYNANGQITRTEHSDGTWETYSYNADGQLIEAVNQSTNVTLLRDGGGNIIAEEQDGYTVESTFDPQGNKIGIQSSLGAKINLDRNDYGFVTQTEATVAEETSWKASFKYNSIGQEVERVLPGNVRSTFRYDTAGRPIAQRVTGVHREHRHRSYRWNANDQLRTMTNELSNGTVNYTHDSVGNLASARYEDKQFDYKLPDEVGNLYRSRDQQDRTYGAGGKLLSANGNNYKYDEEGNLITKQTPKGDWNYTWQGNGMLQQVNKPDGTRVAFEYDALGRRTAKIVLPKMTHKESLITRFVWNGNVPLHEWKYYLDNRPKLVVNEEGILEKEVPEPLDNLTTWVFDEGTFKPAAKIVDGKTFSIITDYLGTPVEMYDANGKKTWEVEYDIYGKIREQSIGHSNDCPFRYQGQYEDVETGLYYNRHRYYTAEEGVYLSQDPIGLYSGQFNLYSYVENTNSLIDIFGLFHHNSTGHNVYGLYDVVGTDDFGEDILSDKPYYIGITNDVDTRRSQHKNSGRLTKNGTTALVPLHENIKYGEARGFEQAYMDHYETKTGTVGKDISQKNRGNKINSFDSNNKTRVRARQNNFESNRKKKAKTLKCN